MHERKSLTVVGDNLGPPKVKGCLSITCPPQDQLSLLGPLALKLCLATCWQDNIGIAKLAWVADYERFFACLPILAMASEIPFNTKLG